MGHANSVQRGCGSAGVLAERRVYDELYSIFIPKRLEQAFRARFKDQTIAPGQCRTIATIGSSERRRRGHDIEVAHEDTRGV